MKTLAVAAIALIACSGASSAQDQEYLRALERAQRSRPAQLTSVARIAPEGEPGTPLVINGRVFRADGRTPAEGLIVFAYHTDRTGVYDVRSNGAHSWRLKGWAITGADGRFEFRTIRPGAYPGRTEPQHVHLTIEGPNLPRQGGLGILFDDDPRVSSRERADSKAAGIFGSVRQVTRRDGVDHVAFNIRIASDGRF